MAVMQIGHSLDAAAGTGEGEEPSPSTSAPFVPQGPPLEVPLIVFAVLLNKADRFSADLSAVQDTYIEPIIDALKEYSPFGRALQYRRIDYTHFVRWIPVPDPAQEVPFLEKDALVVMRGVRWDRRKRSFLSNGVRMPFTADPVLRFYKDDDDEWQEAGSDGFRGKSLLVVLRPPDAHSGPPRDGKVPGAEPYFLVASHTTSAIQMAHAIARSFGKVLGLGEESTNPSEVSAPDYWVRPLPNVWCTTSPASETVTWAWLYGQHDASSPAVANVSSTIVGGLGTAGSMPISDSANLELRTPLGPCIMKEPLVRVAGAPSAAGKFCRVCANHLATVLGVKHHDRVPLPLGKPAEFDASNDRLGQLEVVPWTGAEAVQVFPWASVERPNWAGSAPTAGKAETDDKLEGQWLWSDGAKASITLENSVTPRGRTLLMTFRASVAGTNGDAFTFTFGDGTSSANRPVWATSGSPSVYSATSEHLTDYWSRMTAIDSRLSYSPWWRTDRNTVEASLAHVASTLLRAAFLAQDSGDGSGVLVHGVSDVALPTGSTEHLDLSSALRSHEALEFLYGGRQTTVPHAASPFAHLHLRRQVAGLLSNQAKACKAELRRLEEEGSSEQMEYASSILSEDPDAYAYALRVASAYVCGLGTPGFPPVERSGVPQADVQSDGAIGLVLPPGEQGGAVQAMWSYPGYCYLGDRLAWLLKRELDRGSDGNATLLAEGLGTSMPGTGVPPQQLA